MAKLSDFPPGRDGAAQVAFDVASVLMDCSWHFRRFGMSEAECSQVRDAVAMLFAYARRMRAAADQRPPG